MSVFLVLWAPTPSFSLDGNAETSTVPLPAMGLSQDQCDLGDLRITFLHHASTSILIVAYY